VKGNSLLSDTMKYAKIATKALSPWALSKKTSMSQSYSKNHEVCHCLKNAKHLSYHCPACIPESGFHRKWNGNGRHVNLP
jgi:hypothetical protein